MEIVKILGIDPSLRNTGLAIVTFNSELGATNKEAYKVLNCQTLVNPQKYTGTDAILNMIDMMQEECQKNVYKEVGEVLIESPAIMFNKTWSGGTISSIAHVAGAAVALFGVEKAHIFRPNEWNKTRKKEVTHAQTISVLGDSSGWHYEKRIKSEKYLEHVLDAASIALWWIKSNYLEE